MSRFLPALLLSCFALLGVSAHAEAPANTLTAEEQAAGWKLLFDGSSTAGWRGIGKGEFPKVGWSVKEGTLHLEQGPGGGDIVSDESFDSFELTWEWKIQPGGNSGVKYNLPDPKTATACEYQLIDDDKNADGRAAGGKRVTGALYDAIVPAPTRKVQPPGQWNSSRILVQGDKVEHWLNGTKTVEFTFGSPELAEAKAASKFKNRADWGMKHKSPILLQDHGDEVAFRNIKIRPIGEK